MGIPITIKKRKMTLKPTVTEENEPSPDGADETVSEFATEDTPSAFIAPSFQVKPEAGTSHVVVGTLAIVATLLFMVSVFIQWMEWSDIITAFPRPIQTGQIVLPPPT